MARRTTDFQTIRSEGGLLPPTLLRRVGEVYSDFVVLWVVAHATRFAPREGERPDTCWLEQSTKLAAEQGTRGLGSSLARQLQCPDSDQDLRTGDGAMAKAFDRMLFLTATPFQLGHHELTRVLERFADVRWDANELGSPDSYHQQLSDLGKHLNESQRTAIALQRSWSRLRPEDCDGDLESWWTRLVQSSRESLNNHQRSVVDDYDAAKRSRDIAEKAPRPWVVRHNKGAHWDGTDVTRRQRIDGAAVAGHTVSGGLPIPPPQLLPSSWLLEVRSSPDRTCWVRRCPPPTRPSGSRGTIAMRRGTSRTSCPKWPQICRTRDGTCVSSTARWNAPADRRIRRWMQRFERLSISGKRARRCWCSRSIVTLAEPCASISAKRSNNA